MSDRPSLPNAIQVEPTTRCNLACIMCNTECRMRSSRQMSLAEFKTILSRFPVLERVTLHGIGEPLLNPDFLSMAAWVKTNGIRLFFNTNLTLVDEPTAQALLALDVDEIRVSLDAAAPGLYQQIRGRDAFAEVVAGLKRLVSIKRTRASRTHIKIVTVAMQENIEQLPALTQLAVDLEVDELLVQNMQFWSGNDAYAHRREGCQADALFAETHARCTQIAAGKLSFKMPRAGTSHGCNWPWTSLFVTVEGEVTPCCNCPDPRVLSFGNLHTQSLEEIWWGEEYRKFRESLAGGAAIPSICRGCVIYEGRFKEY